MKKLLLSLPLLLLGYSAASQITSFPYTEDFEAGTGAWTPSGALWEHGIPSTINMSSANTACINNAFVTNLTGDYTNSAANQLTSPVFDFSGLAVDAVLRFDMFRDLESCCDEVWVEMTVDGGVTWQKVLGPGTNWYNDLSNQWWDNNSNGWETTSATLPGTAGLSNVQVRFFISSDGSVTNEGVGVDNIYVGDGQFTDLELVALVSPVSSPNLGSAETITVTLTNNGTSTVSFTDYAICYDGDVAQACETTTTDIAPGATVNVVLLGTWDLSAEGTYNIDIYLSSIIGDMMPCNDTLNLSITHYLSFSSFPYSEDFENGAGDWLTDGDPLNNWQHGIPSTSVFSTADNACANNAIVTNLTGDYSNSAMHFINSPFFDFSALTSDPLIRFDMLRDLESCCDETWLEMTTDAGVTWNKVLGPGLNWYNDLTNEWWDNSVSTWTETSTLLVGAAGNSSVRLRFVMSSDGSITNEGVGFDNIYIGDANFFDLELVDVVAPGATVCSAMPASDSITVTITNNGTATANANDYSICLNGDLPQACETTTTDILAGETVTITLLSTANFPTAGTYNVNYYLSSAVGTPKACDDSMTVTHVVSELPVSNIADSISCDDVDLTTFAASTILWSTGATTPTITVTTSGQYTVELNNPGCPTVNDTVVVTINSATSGTDLVSACDSHTWIDGNTYTSDNNTATHVLTNVAGCDSIVTLDLTINTINTATTTAGFTITSDVAGATYQWIDCDDNNAVIAGETAQSYTATANGNYAVIVTENSCSDTSACVEISTIGLLENDLGTQFILYPNPTTGSFTIDFSEVQEEMTVRVRNLSGQLVDQSQALNTNSLELMIENAAGVYLVEIENQNKQTAIIRVIKK